MHEIENRTTYGYMCDTNALKFLEPKFIFLSLCYIRHLKKKLGLGKSNLAICSGRDLLLEVSSEQLK